MGLRSSLHTQRKNRKDFCPICNNSLYLNSRISKRVGILNEFDEVEEWMCPFCDSIFNVNGKPTKLYGTMNVEGEA